MRALTWQANRSVTVEDVPEAKIEEADDIVIRVTSAAICGSDLHLYNVLGPFLRKGDILGHETMGIVESVGKSVRSVALGDRVVIPFVIACGHCFMCERGLTSQCETTQNRHSDTGADLYGYTELYGAVPGGQAEYLRVRRADANAIVVGDELPDHRYLFLSDILPTAWQAVQFANVPYGGSLAVLGLGPVGQLASRVAKHLGYEVFAVDPVVERREMAERHGIRTFDLTDDVAEHLRSVTQGRGPDSVVDAVGMEAHGSPTAELLQKTVGLLPDNVAKTLMLKAGTDRLAALHSGIDLVRRGGTLSLAGVYAGAADPMPLMSMFDKQIHVRMGQCNVHRWQEVLLPLAEAANDPLGLDDLVTHSVSLEDGPTLYKTFSEKSDGCIKVVLHP